MNFNTSNHNLRLVSLSLLRQAQDKLSKTWGWLLISLLITSCEDIFEKDLSKEKVEILAPANNTSSKILTQNFIWNKVEKADRYLLQIASPSFANLQQMLVDSTISNTKFGYTLTPGEYQWRIRAMNGSSETPYVTYSLSIDTTSDLSQQTILVISPANNLATKIMTHTFSWQPLFGSEEYRFKITNTQTNSVLADVLLTEESTTYTLNEGQYQWQVRAQNSGSNSIYATQTLTIDTTAPVVSNPLLPAHQDTTSTSINLVWNRNNSATGDSLYIYTDSLVSAPFHRGFHTATSYSFTATTGNTYYWRLRSKDAAGNVSGYSSLFKFWIQ